MTKSKTKRRESGLADQVIYPSRWFAADLGEEKRARHYPRMACLPVASVVKLLLDNEYPRDCLEKLRALDTQSGEGRVINRCETCDGALVKCVGDTSTYTAYISPPGHNHDDNSHTKTYECEFGHKTVLSLKRVCPVPGCDWKSRGSHGFLDGTRGVPVICGERTQVDAWPIL